MNTKMQKILVEENFCRKWSEKKMERENGLRIVECLRGRLLAERTASRIAKEEAEQMANKIVELEIQLKREIKARNRAEKKLKFIMKKLESLNVSRSLDKSEFTSPSSSDSSMENEQNVSKIIDFSEGDVNSADEETLSCVSEAGSGELTTRKCCSVESSEETSSSMASNSCQQNVVQINKFKRGHDHPEMKEAYNSSGDGLLELDDHILKTSIEEDGVNEENRLDHDRCVDNSMAL